MATQLLRTVDPLSSNLSSSSTVLSQISRSFPRRTFFSANTPLSRPRTTRLPTKTRILNFVLPLRGFRRIRFNSTKPSGSAPNTTPNLSSPEPTTLSGKLKKLSRDYGYSAVAIYFALSALDFPFCFLAVRLLGTDRIGYAEHVVVETIWKVVRIPFPNLRKKEDEKVLDRIAGPEATEERKGEVVKQEGLFMDEVKEAQKENEGADASIYTQLALAYAIHKSFIFIRVPLTVAVTPKIVKTLRGWGWKIGKKTPPAAPPSA